MPDGWEIAVREERTPLKARRLYVSLNRRGEIVLNEAAFAAIGRPANVTLVYDAGTGSIGIKYPVAMDRHFFPVRGYGRDRKMRIVRARQMLKQFGIEVERTIVFQNVRREVYARQPMLVVQIEI